MRNGTHIHRPPVGRRNGFTLLELVLALLLLALLTGMIFTTAHSSLMLGNNIVKTQGTEMKTQAFFDFLEHRFSTLPGNTRMELTATDSGSHYLSDLSLQNVPSSFSWGGTERSAMAIRLSTQKRANGYLDIVLSYYENEIMDPESTDGQQSNTDDLPFAEITLLTDVAYFEWRVLDGRTMEWQFDWDLPGRLPLQLELVCSFGSDGQEIRQILWIPARQNPETFMAQLGQQAGTGSSSPDDTQPEAENPDDTQPPPPSTGSAPTSTPLAQQPGNPDR